jgi:hypothetical protein
MKSPINTIRNNNNNNNDDSIKKKEKKKKKKSKLKSFDEVFNRNPIKTYL